MTGETTERINRHQLVRLLDTMSSVERQAITHRMRISDLETATWSVPAPESTASGPRHPRPPSLVAAMLPPVKPLRSARPTLTGRVLRIPEPEPVTVAAPPLVQPSLEVAAAIELSPMIVAQLSPEEIAMLPPQFRPVASAVPLALDAPPRIEPAAVVLRQPHRRWIALVLGALFAAALFVWFAVRGAVG